MRKLTVFAATVMVLGLATCSSVQAGLLNGHELTIQNLYQGSPFPGYTSTFTVDSTPGAVEVPEWGTFRTLSIDLFDTGPASASIVFTVLTTGSFGPSPNLAHFLDTNSSIAAFSSFSIGFTDIAGLAVSRLSFTADTFSLDLGGLSAARGQSVRLDLVGQVVPEPSSMVLSAIGVIAALIRFRVRMR